MDSQPPTRRRQALCTLAGLTLLVACSLLRAGRAAEEPAPVRMPLAQARQTVDLLNDAYVNAVVVTHSTYVKDRGTPAAATMARRVFASMKAKGWPETRWLSTTGRPFNPDANPRDQFERDAVAALKAGKPRFERVERAAGGAHLRVVTLVPLVDQSCAMCHTRDKVGDPIGGLAYIVPLLEEK